VKRSEGIHPRKAEAMKGCRASVKGTPQPRMPKMTEKSMAKADMSKMGKSPFQGKGGGTGGGGA
jgi:hypothetical protein